MPMKLEEKCVGPFECRETKKDGSFSSLERHQEASGEEHVKGDKKKSQVKAKTSEEKLGKKNQLVQWTLEWKRLKKEGRQKPPVVFSANAPRQQLPRSMSWKGMTSEKEEEEEEGLENTKDVKEAQEEDPDLLESDYDEEDVNRIGDIPLSWYDSMKHIGYDISGARVMKSLDDSAVSHLLRESSQADSWREVEDHRNQRLIQLSHSDLQIIHNMRAGRYPSALYDPYGEDSTVIFDDPDAALHPVASGHTPKRRFLPSVWETKRIQHLIRLIREGRLKEGGKAQVTQVYDVWKDAITVDVYGSTRGNARGPPSFPAPKMDLPGHAESYNPSPEYLFTEQEKQDWLSSHPEDRESNFLPQQYSCLRRVPAYEGLLVERFQRCLDLYLCPRTIKSKMNIDPESLLPQLPPVENLRPFPTCLGMTFESSDATRGVALAFDCTGTYLAVLRSSGYLEVFDVFTTQLVLRWTPKDRDVSKQTSHSRTAQRVLAFSPKHPVVLLALDTFVYVFVLPLPGMRTHPHHGERSVPPEEGGEIPPSFSAEAAQQHLQVQSRGACDGTWERLEHDQFYGWKISHPSCVTSVNWHRQGVYFLSICTNAPRPCEQLFIHSLAKLKSLCPLKNSGTAPVKQAVFHPAQPFLYTASENCIRLYNLQGERGDDSTGSKRLGLLMKKFRGVKNVLDMAVHPSGDHLVVGSENQRVTWFDEDLGEHPYKILRCHKGAVKTVGFHRVYPLLCSGSSDGCVYIFHAKVYEDLLNPPALIPVKKLSPGKDLSPEDDPVASVVQCAWHPFQPFLATSLGNGKVGIFV